MITLWESLDFEVKTYQNLSRDKMAKKLQKVAKRTDLSQYDCLVVCLMSHGEQGAVCGTDGRTLEINEIQSYFYASNCPSLAGKPKMFIIQACQGNKPLKGRKV